MRPTGYLSINELGATRQCGLDCRKEARNQRPEISKPVRFRLEHNDGDREAIQVLLKGQVSINGDEYIEVLRCKGQQRSILDCRPTHLMSSLHDQRYRAQGANRRIRRETPSRRRFNDSVLRFLQESDDMLSRHRWEPLEKIID